MPRRDRPAAHRRARAPPPPRSWPPDAEPFSNPRRQWARRRATPPGSRSARGRREGSLSRGLPEPAFEVEAEVEARRCGVEGPHHAAEAVIPGRALVVPARVAKRPSEGLDQGVIGSFAGRSCGPRLRTRAPRRSELLLGPPPGQIAECAQSALQVHGAHAQDFEAGLTEEPRQMIAGEERKVALVDHGKETRSRRALFARTPLERAHVGLAVGCHEPHQAAGPQDAEGLDQVVARLEHVLEQILLQNEVEVAIGIACLFERADLDREIEGAAREVRGERRDIDAVHLAGRVAAQGAQKKAERAAHLEHAGRRPQTPHYARQKVRLALGALLLARVGAVTDLRSGIEIGVGIERSELGGREPRAHLAEAARGAAPNLGVEHAAQADLDFRRHRSGRAADVTGLAVRRSRHAPTALSTSSTWPGTFTLRKTAFTLPSAPITNVDRSTPSDELPLGVFLAHVP